MGTDVEIYNQTLGELGEHHRREGGKIVGTKGVEDIKNKQTNKQTMAYTIKSGLIGAHKD